MSDMAAPEHELRFVGAVGGENVPAAVLAETLLATQRVVHLLAMATRGQSLSRRARVPQDVERAFPVLCLVPREGSYIAPIMIGDPTSGLLTPLEAQALSDSFEAVLSAAANGDTAALQAAIPDARWREAVADAVGRMLPRPSSGFALSIRGGRLVRELALSAAREKIEALATRAVNTSGSRAVIGYLQAIDFGERKLRLRHPATSRTFDCIYAARDDVEPLLLANARELIQVVGEVEVDAGDHPVRVMEVSDIRPVDLDPMPVPVVMVDNVAIRPVDDRRLQPRLDETSQIFLLEHAELGIDLAEETRADLEDALRHLLPILWLNYAKADDGVLTKDAQALKQRLLAAFTEVPGATPQQ